MKKSKLEGALHIVRQKLTFLPVIRLTTGTFSLPVIPCKPEGV